LRYVITLLFGFLFLFSSCNTENVYEYDFSVLAGKNICIDPGHQQYANTESELVYPGGTVTKQKCSSGTKGITTGVPEYVIVLDVGIKLKDLLESYEATVIMTRDSHDVNISNIERAEIGNDSQSDIMIRIHADGSNNSSDHGVSVLVPLPTFIKDSSILTKSRSAGRYILQNINEPPRPKGRGILRLL
jgi:N-acetylmuramoyl-L-alanine amidase